MAEEMPPPPPPKPVETHPVEFISAKNSLSPDSELILVYRRAVEDSEIPSFARKLLRGLFLSGPGIGVFLKADDVVMDILGKVERFVKYGCPAPETVKGLIHCLGTVKVNNQARFLNEDNVPEQAFGKYNIVCIEDVVNEIVNVGPHFDHVNDALATFQINVRKRKRHCHGRVEGTRGDRLLK